jgi:hypothetical protein
MSAMSLGPPSDAAPPPAATLLAAVEGMKAVRTRVPWRTVAALGSVMAAIPVGAVLFLGPRNDLAALPVAWVAATAVVWGAGVLVTLLAATWPRRGEVLPDTGKARLTAVIVAGLLLLLGIFGTADPTAETVVPRARSPGLATGGGTARSSRSRRSFRFWSWVVCSCGACSPSEGCGREPRWVPRAALPPGWRCTSSAPSAAACTSQSPTAAVSSSAPCSGCSFSPAFYAAERTSGFPEIR